MGVARKILRLGGRLVRHPAQTLRALPDLLESARMSFRGNSTFRRPEDLTHASNCPARMIDEALEMWRPASVLDVGCGTGKVLDHLMHRGIADLQGLEGSELAIRAATHPNLIRQVDLSKPVDLARRFDLIYTVEVAEHIHPSGADEFVRTLTRHGDRILMTAARPGQGGLGHLNEQEPAYWEQKMAAAGFQSDPAARETLKAVKDLYHENLMVFVRRA